MSRTQNNYFYHFTNYACKTVFFTKANFEMSRPQQLKCTHKKNYVPASSSEPKNRKLIIYFCIVSVCLLRGRVRFNSLCKLQEWAIKIIFKRTTATFWNWQHLFALLPFDRNSFSVNVFILHALIRASLDCL